MSKLQRAQKKKMTNGTVRCRADQIQKGKKRKLKLKKMKRC